MKISIVHVQYYYTVAKIIVGVLSLSFHMMAAEFVLAPF